MTQILTLQPTAINRFKSILSVTKDIEHRCGATLKRSQPLVPSSPTFSVTLPPPNDITADLLNMGISSLSAQHLSKYFVQKGLDLKHVIEDKIRKYISSARLSQSPPPPELQRKAAAVFERLYEKLLVNWTTQTLDMVHSRRTGKQQRSQKTRQPFNQDFIPYLEKYFEENAFPSHGDKAEMARKSQMSYRQVDVWFQNRRSRAKKEGKSLRRLLRHEEPNLSFKESESHMGDKIVPENERMTLVVPDVSEYEWQNDDENISALTTKSPRTPDVIEVLNKELPPQPHTFPSVYRGYNPFLTRDSKCTFPPPVWSRHPAKSIERRPMMDFDEFIACFAGMSVREGPRKRPMGKSSHDTRKPMMQTPSLKPDHEAATPFFTIRPPPAPLPALIRSPVSVPPLPIHPNSNSRPNNSLTSNPTANANERPTKRRKIAPLPRYSPAGTSIRRRVQSPASDPIPPSPHSSPTRTSSFSSDYSSRMSLSSESSSTSSAVATPESSPTCSPYHLTHVPLLSKFYPLQNADDVLANPSTGALAQVDGFQLDFSSGIDFYTGSDKGAINTNGLPSITPVCIL